MSRKLFGNENIVCMGTLFDAPGIRVRVSINGSKGLYKKIPSIADLCQKIALLRRKSLCPSFHSFSRDLRYQFVIVCQIDGFCDIIE